MTTSKLEVPDANTLSTVQKLCDLTEPYQNFQESDDLFTHAMQQIVAWHAEHSDFYNKLLRLKKFKVDSIKSVGACADIPFVLANFFKMHEVMSRSKSDISIHLTSSGTTGQKSQMFFDTWSLGSAQRMVDHIFAHYGWVTPKQPVNYLLYSYEQKIGMKLGTAYTDNFLCKYAPAKEVFSALRFASRDRHEFDSFGTIAALQRFAQDGLPVRIFGFPAFLHFTLQQMQELEIPNLILHPESLVFLGGGWKSHQDQAISKTDLYQKVVRQLGIPDARIRDGFGSVEHCIPYVECAYHQFHVPVWSRVFIRDVKTLQPLGEGEKGFLSFVSPYITSVPAHSVVMGDLASWYAPEKCPCNMGTPYFVVHGRAGSSKNRSCAVAAAELLKRDL